MPNTGQGRRKSGKPVAIPQDLHMLAGPISGTVQLPAYLDWSGHPVYDLDEPGRIIDLYRAVINEAMYPSDLHSYLDESMLKRLWTYMWLPGHIRKLWEEHFPVLAELSRLVSA